MENFQTLWDWVVTYVSANLVFSIICGITVIALILRSACIPYCKFRLRSVTLKWAVVIVVLEVIYGLFYETIHETLSPIYFYLANENGVFMYASIIVLGFIILYVLAKILPKKLAHPIAALLYGSLIAITAIIMSYKTIIGLIVAGYFILGGNLLKLLRSGYWETFEGEHHLEILLGCIGAIILGVIIEYFFFGMKHRLEDDFDFSGFTSKYGHSSWDHESESTRSSVTENMDYRSSGKGDPSDCRDDNGNITSSAVENYYTNDDGSFDDSAIESDNNDFSKD